MWLKPDPSKNVLDLIHLTSKRLEDMLDIHVQRVDERFRTHVEYGNILSLAESKRISAVRDMDVKTYETAMNQAVDDRMAISNRMTAMNDGLRSLISAAQDVLNKQLEQRAEQLSDRITMLEKSQYQTQGKDQVSKTVVASLAAVAGAVAAMLFQHFVIGK